MITPSIYINLEDDVSKIVTRLKREKASQVILVCPKRCMLFSDSINLRLLKKQADLLGKEVFILTMDERGQQYATEAGFKLRSLPKGRPATGVSDIAPSRPAAAFVPEAHPELEKEAEPVIVQEKSPTEEPEIPEEPEQEYIAEVAPEPALSSTPQKRTPQPVSVITATSQVSVGAPANDTIFYSEPLPQQPVEVQPEKTGRRMGRMLVGLLAISLIVIIAVVFVVLPHAEVTVYAKSDSVPRDFVITVSTALNAPDIDHQQIPAQKIVMTLDTDSQFSSTGKKPIGSKADGTIYIYNFTSQPINLKSSTTSFTVGNKTYAMVPQLIQVKPTKYKAGTKEVDPASLGAPVEVQASEGGEDYNLPADTRMEITNKVFGSKPQVLYAKTAEALTGGNSRYISIVTDQDINNSQAQLNQNLIGEVRQGLTQNNMVMPDGAFAIETVQFSSDKTAGTESPVFNSSLKAKITGLAFSENDLKTLITTRIKQNMPQDKPIDIKTTNLTYKLNSAPDLNNGTEVINVHFEGKATYQMSVNDIPSQLAGKPKDQVNVVIKSHPEIDHVDVTLAPAWQTTFPFLKNRIDVQVVQ